jgi:hypothetical protein
VHANLMSLRSTPDAPTVPAAPSRLRGKGLRSAVPTTPGAAPQPSGRLVGKLISKITDRPRE